MHCSKARDTADRAIQKHEMKNAEESLPIYGRNPRRSLVYIAIQLVHSVIYACCVVRVAVVAILIVVVIIIDGIVAIVIGIIRLVGFLLLEQELLYEDLEL